MVTLPLEDGVSLVVHHDVSLLVQLLVGPRFGRDGPDAKEARDLAVLVVRSLHEAFLFDPGALR